MLWQETIKFQDGCTFHCKKYSRPVAQCCVVLLGEKSLAKALLPGQLELPVVIGTVSQIEVDQGLIGDAFCVGQRLEVVDGAAVDVDGDLLFQPVRVGIFSWI